MDYQNKRWGDPVAWKCLDDEQRDIIKEWYDDLNKRRDEEKRELLKKCRSAALDPCVCVITWCAIADSSGKTLFGFLVSLALVVLFFYLGTGLIYDSALRTEKVVMRRTIWAVITAIFAIKAYFG